MLGKAFLVVVSIVSLGITVYRSWPLKTNKSSLKQRHINENTTKRFIQDHQKQDQPRVDQFGRRLAIIVVDPISTGANLAWEAARRGFQVISMASGFLSASTLALVDPSIKIEYVAEVMNNLKNTAATITELHTIAREQNLVLHALLAGSEPGVEVAEEIAEKLELAGNNTAMSLARRDKYVMGETVRNAGIRAARQKKCANWADVESFLHEWNPQPFKVVIKPTKSAGSDHVYMCESIDELRMRYDSIMGQQNQLGFENDAVLVQEYLEGPEYVVDTVSRYGKHKVAALWLYDKRKHAGFNFVYYGQSTVDGSSPEAKVLCEYLRKVLDALHIVHSAGHAEIILTKTGPCLVEVGARCQGGEGTFIPLANQAYGYNQCELYVSAQISDEEFEKYPDEPGTEIIAGYKVDLVSSVTGKLVRLDHLEEIEKLKSFQRFDAMPHSGDQIHVTIDCFTECGSVTLANADKEQLLLDTERIRELEKTMFVVQ